MSGIEFYIVVLLVYLGTDLLAAWGLNLEFGIAGVANLAFIVVVAAGAYTYSILSLGPDTGNGGFQQYVLGFRFPFFVAVVAAALAGAAVGMVIGITGLKRIRPDYQAMVMLVISLMAATVVGADSGFLNGLAGLSLVPNPFSSLNSTFGPWVYVGMVAFACLVGYFVMRRFTGGPMGRRLRAMRDDEHAAAAMGVSVVRLRLMSQAVGGAFGGVSGALLVAFIGGWSPGGWAYVETLALLTAIIVGGMGNDFGVSIGTFLIAVLLLQGVQFLPPIRSHSGLTEALGWIVLGVLTIAFLWIRPQGIFRERRPRYRWRLGAGTRAGADSGAGTSPAPPS
ncbi:MAG TPA: branched-chain amino acid ABC transporter permease [Candidatus Dormibacteraeota bacterium]|nr:branched-chain amino acid ABC transporter permease [Candidatus Dormibacteraeota bacterium]